MSGDGPAVDKGKKADAATWIMRAGALVGIMALLMMLNESTRQLGRDYSSAVQTGAIAVLLLVVAFGIRLWKFTERHD